MRKVKVKRGLPPLEVAVLPTKEQFNSQWKERVAAYWQPIHVADVPINDLREALRSEGVNVDLLSESSIKLEFISRFGPYWTSPNRTMSTEWGLLNRDQLWNKMVEVHNVSHDIREIHHYNAWLQHLHLR